MPMTTYRSLPIPAPKDEEINELLNEVENRTGCKLYVEEYEDKRWFQTKKYFTLLHPLGVGGEYQIVNIGSYKGNVLAYLYGILFKS